MLRRNRVICLSFILFMAAPNALASFRESLTPTEKNWIKNHPVVTYTPKDNWPLEYHEGEKVFGLSRGFLDIVSRQTGLTFVYIPKKEASASQPMMLPAVYAKLLTEEEKKGWLYTSAWMNSIPMVITRNETSGFRNFDSLMGKKVAVSEGSGYSEWLKRNYPEIHLIVKDNILEAMRSVDKKESDAVLGTGMVVLPILQRSFSERMAITSQPPELAVGINMAVRDRYPELQSILNKSFASMPAADVERAYDTWVGIARLGTPGVGVIWEHYRLELLVFFILFILLVISLRITLLAKREAQSSEQRKGDFLAMMSHEIRTPMNAVIASLELLRQTALPHKRKQYIDLAYSSSQNLLELLNNVLDHSKLSQKRMKLERNIFELSEMLEAFCETQMPAATRKGLHLQLIISAYLQKQWVIADVHRLRQILSNLISNAIKFTHRGRIIIDVAEVLVNDRFNGLSFTITDTGIGMPVEAQTRLLNAWEQMEGQTQQGGSGLGLFICHELIKLMQGEIKIISDVGQGTTISFTVNVEKYEGQPSSDSSAEILLPDYKKRLSVLVIEDHPANQQLLKEQLDVMSCLYEIAGDGENALEILKEENYFDIILLDCNLPGRDGYEVVQIIRELEESQRHDRTPVVAISALNTEAHINKCMQSGMDDVLTKPIRLADLATVLRKWCKPSDTTIVTDSKTFYVNSDVLTWLFQDVLEFKNAAENNDVRYLIHYIHRIKGVALMYQLSELAEFTAECEIKLRSSNDIGQWPVDLWSTKIHSIISKYSDQSQ